MTAARCVAPVLHLLDRTPDDRQPSARCAIAARIDIPVGRQRRSIPQLGRNGKPPAYLTYLPDRLGQSADYLRGFPAVPADSTCDSITARVLKSDIWRLRKPSSGRFHVALVAEHLGVRRRPPLPAARPRRSAWAQQPVRAGASAASSPATRAQSRWAGPPDAACRRWWQAGATRPGPR